MLAKRLKNVGSMRSFRRTARRFQDEEKVHQDAAILLRAGGKLVGDRDVIQLQTYLPADERLPILAETKHTRPHLTDPVAMMESQLLHTYIRVLTKTYVEFTTSFGNHYFARAFLR